MTEIPSGFDRRAEVERLLAEDETVLGRYWEYSNQGLTPEQMREAEGTATLGWVYNYRTLLGVIRESAG